MSEVAAWIRPLRPDKRGSERVQYFVRTPGKGSLMGAAYGEWQAHDLIVDFVASEVPDDEWAIERKRPYGKWAA